MTESERGFYSSSRANGNRGDGREQTIAFTWGATPPLAMVTGIVMEFLLMLAHTSSFGIIP
ncbi:MAG: hypothetical protein AABP62_04120 [Planctomycetota bacterium]